MSEDETMEKKKKKNQLSFARQCVEYARHNKLTAVGGTWAATMATLLAYQKFSPDPLNAKLMRARLVGQFTAVISVLATLGLDHVDEFEAWWDSKFS